MKIAVLISGQPRNLTNNIIELLKEQNINFDVFINYWKADNGTYSNIGCKECKYIEFLDLKNVKTNVVKVDEDIDKKIIEKFNPKKISSQNQIKELSNTQSQFYSIKKAFELIDNPDEYDFIIQTRFDVNIKGNFDFLNKEKNSDKIFLLYYNKFYYLFTSINFIMLLLLYLLRNFKNYLILYLILYLIIYLYIIIDYGTINTLLHPFILNFNIFMPKFINFTLSVIPKKNYHFLRIYDKIEKNELCEQAIISYFVKNNIEISFIESLKSEINRNYNYK